MSFFTPILCLSPPKTRKTKEKKKTKEKNILRYGIGLSQFTNMNNIHPEN